jgi:aminoglycoside/choline kinase family phosphotransferase
MTSLLPAEADAFLRSWLPEGWAAEALAGDVSSRMYFRVIAPSAERYVLAFYPQDARAGVTRFLDAHRAIAPHAPVPRVVRHDHAVVAQQDVGDLTLLEVLRSDRRRGIELYASAIDLLLQFQKAAASAGTLNPPFDETKFFEELEMAREWYVERLLGRDGSPLIPFFRSIARLLVSHPYVLCHRDYHGQNIHVFNDGLYMIDFQDLRMGPDTYDLASLLRDRGVAATLGTAEDELIALYARGLSEQPVELRKRYFQTLLQRAVKTLGTFAKVSLTTGRKHYLDFIPGAIESVVRASAELPEFAGMPALLRMD